MKTKTLSLIAMAWLALGASLQAQAPAGQPKAAVKSPADLAAEEFFKLRNDKAAKPDEERFKKLIAAGLAFIEENPTHGQINGVVNGLANFSDTMGDKNLAPHRANFRGNLLFTLIDERGKADLKPETQAAVAALEAAVRDSETREIFTKDNLDTLREKIDKVASMPGGGRFLVDRERSYVEILTKGMGPPVGEKYLRKLTEHTEKGVANWARTDLAILEIKKAPYELKFTALDGKPCDVATMRGKALALVFFTAGNEASVKNLATVKAMAGLYKRELAVVAVSFDKENEREKMEAVVKTNKLSWPVYFDGKEAKNDWAPKLNVTRVPAIALFDQKGILLTNNQRADRLEAEVKRLFKIQ